MIDSRAIANFIYPDIIKNIGLDTEVIDKTYNLIIIDRIPINYNNKRIDIQTKEAKMIIGTHREMIQLYITIIKKYRIVLGIL